MLMATRNDMELLEKNVRESGVNDVEMIARAGQGAAKAILEWSNNHYPQINLCGTGKTGTPCYLVLAGAGKNGADVWRAAAALQEAGEKVILADCCFEKQYEGPALKTVESILEKHCFESIALENDLDFQRLKSLLQPGTVVVDGLVGIGLKGELSGARKEIVKLLNRPERTWAVIALDIPSGLGAEDGGGGEIVHADLTLGMGFMKRGYFLGKGPACCGEIQLVDFGCNAAYLHDRNAERVAGGEWAFGVDDAARLLAPRPAECHKNSLGRVVILGGSAEYNGAPFLAASAALRMGSGLVTLVLPEAARKRPGEAALIVRELLGARHFEMQHLEELRELLNRADAILFGPGIGRQVSADFLREMLALKKPMILDADGLRLLADNPSLLPVGGESYPLILTPHQGEMDALLKAFAPKAVGLSRGDQAQVLAERTGAVVVLKGPRTVVAAKDGRSYNVSGNPALATAGSGDVLAGMTVALAAQVSLADAARLAVYLHGAAADLYVRTRSQRGLIADELPALLSKAIRQICPW